MSRFMYKGVDLSPFLNVLKIERTVGNSRNVSTNDAPKIGVNVHEVKFGAKIIKVKVSMASRDMKAFEFVDTIEYPTATETNLNKLREQVTSLLHAEEEFKLELPDEPDRFYMAIPQGDVELEGIADWYDETTIEFIVPDGVAHSTTYRQFDNPTETAEKLVFNLVNNGNVPAYPIITVKNNQENGYIGIINSSGALEIGDREEADKENVKQSEMLLDYRANKILQGYSAAIKTGSLTTSNDWGRNHIQLGTETSGRATWKIPADSSGQTGSLNDYIWGRMICWAGSVTQKGFLRLNVRSSDGAFLYGLQIDKGSFGLECEYSLWVRDSAGTGDKRKSWKFQATHKDTENPFNQNRGWFDILRRDDMLQVFWWGSYNQMKFPELKGLKTGKIELIIGSYQNAGKITHLYLDEIYYRKDFVNVIRDIPNRYPQGSVIVVDSEDDTVFVDGIDKFGDRVQGSGWLKIPPGNSRLEVYSSSWVRTKPTVTVKFEERYL